MTGHRAKLKGYKIDAKGRLVPVPTANLPRNIAIARSKAKRKYAPIPQYEVTKK